MSTSTIATTRIQRLIRVLLDTAPPEAFADPINAAMPDVPYAYGTLIGSMAWEKNIDPPLSPLWISESVATLLFRQRVLKEKVN